jgi:hypothetical protein
MGSMVVSSFEFSRKKVNWPLLQQLYALYYYLRALAIICAY